MYFFDSHAHVHLARFADAQGRRIRLRNAYKHGIRAIVSSAVAPTDWNEALKLAERSRAARKAPAVFAALGIHPYAVQADASDNDGDLDLLATQLSGAASVVAVGECGLDFREGRGLAGREEQVRVCAAQLELARQHQLPAVLHCVGAQAALVELLEAKPRPPCVLHAYSGSPETMARLNKGGHYFSFAANATRDSAKRLHRSLEAAPASQLLIETDSPDQTPATRGPVPNEPAFLVDIARVVADRRGVSLAELAATTFANACRAYGLDLEDFGS